MENINNKFDDKNQVALPKKMFAVIRNDCIAIEVSGGDKNKSETVKLGTLIEIVSNFREDGYYFKIRDCTNNFEKYKTTIYKCSNADCMVVSTDLWPYLLALKREGRFDFVQNVFNRYFNLDMLKLGKRIQIRQPPFLYDFVVTYNGVVKEIGTGYYIGLKFMNDQALISADLKQFTRGYRYGGRGIVVPADWIMLNLYKNEALQTPNPSQSNSTNAPANDKHELTEKVRPPLRLIADPKAIIARGAIPKDNRLQTRTTATQILDNHIQKNTDPNTRICPNENCGNIWISQQGTHVNHERCAKCKTNWCYICSSIHEPGERHGNKSNKKKIVQEHNSLNKAVTATCALSANCYKTNITLSECITLQNCKHIFCKDCIVSMVKMQSSESQYAECAICGKHLEDNEVINITGSEVLKLFLNRRKEQLGSVNAIEMCCCTPQMPNCGISLNCKHKFCRTILSGILIEQFRRFSDGACPICLAKIDDHQIKLLIGQNKLVAEKCRMCSNWANVNLSLCRHSFCQKCISNLIAKQAFDSSKMSINCNICKQPISDLDIRSYGNEEIFAQFKSKIEDKRVFKIKLNDLPFECISCEEWISVNSGVILRCHDSFCFGCCKEFISQQLSFSQNPACPICRHLIDKFEVEAIIGKIHIEPNRALATFRPNTKVVSKPTQNQKLSSNTSDNMNTCSVCYEKIRHKIALKECGHEFCRQCVDASISAQKSNGVALRCPMCRKSIEADQIAISSKTSSSFSNTTLRLNSIPFECMICDHNIHVGCGVILSNCNHWICRDCLTGIILQQIANKQESNCPMCQKRLTDKEVGLLDVGNYRMLLEDGVCNQAPKLSQNGACKLEINKTVDTCSICYEQFWQKIVLKGCGHEFCRHCVERSIEVQQLNETTPRCPMCRKSIEPDEIRVLKMSQTASNAYVAPKSPLRLNNRPFECITCDRNIDPECGVTLTNCDDSFCLDCISNIILQQFTNGLAPKCPICHIEITDEELRTLHPDNL